MQDTSHFYSTATCRTHTIVIQTTHKDVSFPWRRAKFEWETCTRSKCSKAGMSKRPRHRCLFQGCDRTDVDGKLVSISKHRREILLGPGGWREPRNAEEQARWDQVLRVQKAFVCQSHLQTSALGKVRSHACTHAHTREHMFMHTLARTHSLTHAYTISLARARILSHSLTLSRAHTHALTHSRTHARADLGWHSSCCPLVRLALA